MPWWCMMGRRWGVVGLQCGTLRKVEVWLRVACKVLRAMFCNQLAPSKAFPTLVCIRYAVPHSIAMQK